jgi:hypothetical protein
MNSVLFRECSRLIAYGIVSEREILKEVKILSAQKGSITCIVESLLAKLCKWEGSKYYCCTSESTTSTR